MLQSRVRPGELDRRILLIRQITTTPSTNEDAEVGWEPLPLTPNVWARKKDYQGSERVIGDRLEYVHKAVWTIRYRNDINVQNRIVLDTRVYSIISITDNDSNRNGYLDIVTELVDTEFYT